MIKNEEYIVAFFAVVGVLVTVCIIIFLCSPYKYTIHSSLNVKTIEYYHPVYARYDRTNICFASGGQGYTSVPCTKEVMNLVQ